MQIHHPHLSCCPGMSVLKFAYLRIRPWRRWLYRCTCCGRRGFAVDFGFSRKKEAQGESA